MPALDKPAALSALANLTQDLRYGLRQMARRPALYGLALLSLALALGATTALFSVANALYLRGAPGIGEPAGLVAVYSWEPNERWGSFPYSDFTALRDQTGVFSALAAQIFPVGVNLGTAGREPETAQGLLVSGEYFPVLEARPILGRIFGPGAAGAHETGVVISHSLWRRRFGRAPGVIGKAVTINGNSFTVIGVMPEGFRGPRLEDKTEIWIPLDNLPLVASGLIPRDLLTSKSGFFIFLGRLRPGVSAKAATERIDSVLRALRPGDKETPRAALVTGAALRLEPASQKSINLFTALLAAAVALALAAACANVASLLLVRAAERRRELAIRLALGAGRVRIVRQALAESLLLGFTGALLGLGIARLARPLVALLQLPVTDFDLRLDGRVLLFSLTVSQLTALLFGLAPALAASRQSLASVLRDTTAGGRLLPRRLLAAAQVALAMILAIGAGLFLRTLANLGGDRLGFQPGHVLTATIDLTTRGYPAGNILPFYDDLTRRLAALPGVESVSRTGILPFSLQIQIGLFPEGKSSPVEKSGTYVIYAGEGFFHTLGIPLTAGRDFTLRDSPDAPGVAIVNQALAHLAWPGQSPLGKRFHIDPQAPPYEVVGVVANTRYFRPREAEKPVVYLPHRQSRKFVIGQFLFPTQSILLKTSGPPTHFARALREQVRAADSSLLIQDLKTLEEQVDRATARERRSAQLLAILAGLSLALTAVGLYGVLAASVAQRTREIGIRMALGEDRPSILGRILRDALLLGLLGVLAGTGAALGLTALVRNQLFGVTPTDPLTFVLAALLLLAIALLAALAPAWRATRTAPAVALRAG
ncbi:MAG TPA: ADOP family duplicated permease [Thermoanaerobaculia bacterium]|jgi:putative ABC transport system permease protein|nr:ADOP family duplicated permease [Thermoanaerobaculia bacterium]